MKSKLFICFLGLTCTVNAQWENIYTFPTFNHTMSIIAVSNDLYAGTSGNGVLKSQDNGDTWVESNNGIFLGSAYIFSLTSRNDSIYAGGFGEISFSNNGGENWSLLDLNLPLNNNVFALIVKDQYLFAGVGNENSNGVYRKELSGTEWTLMDNGLPENVGVNAFVIQNSSLFAGTESGIYVSTDNGMNWILTDEGMGDMLPVKALYLINGNLLAGTPEGVFVSTDQGSTWTYAAGLPENAAVSSFSSKYNTVVAGTDLGAFASLDDGLTWTDFNEGLENTHSFRAITSLGDYFYAGTYSGILKKAISAPSSVLNRTNLGEAWTIYPNPFSSHTVLELKVPVTNATLTVYNLYGQRVKQINNLSGQTINLQRENLPTGAYFIQLMQNDEIIATGKLVVTND